VKQNIRGINLEKFLGIFRDNVEIDSKKKIRLIFAIKILLGTNAECARYFFHGINPTQLIIFVFFRG
jgi:hypothetical protein